MKFAQSRFKELFKFHAVKTMAARFEMMFKLYARFTLQVIVNIGEDSFDSLITTDVLGGALLCFHDDVSVKR